MASVFGHAALALGLGGGIIAKGNNSKLIVLGVLSSMMPDLDVISFRFGIPYGSMLGHRGVTHSILFAVLWALLIVFLFFRKKKKSKFGVWIYIFLCTISHALLDAMTTGGKGVGFFIPFDADRYFFPWRFIKVSPISISDFFSEWGIRVLASEFYFVLIPSAILGLVLFFAVLLTRRN